MWRGYLFLPLWWLIFALLAEFWLISFFLSFWGLGGILPRNSRIPNLEFPRLDPRISSQII